MSRSDLKLCQEFRLDWDQGSIKILGIIFTPETFDIWDRNSELLLNNVENLLSIWSKQKLTLPSKAGLQKTDFLPVQTDFKFVKPIQFA